MRTKGIVFVVAASLAFSVLNALAQTSADPQPIYRVTVVSRTLQAINYEHRSGPTKIDFEGTVLLPKAKGDAMVESKRGRISIDAKFHHIDPPTKYGREYLTRAPWIMLCPAATIVLTTLAISVIGDWLRDKLDPTLK